MTDDEIAIHEGDVIFLEETQERLVVKGVKRLRKGAFEISVDIPGRGVLSGTIPLPSEPPSADR
jgi:hypothetical protein